MKHIPKHALALTMLTLTGCAVPVLKAPLSEASSTTAAAARPLPLRIETAGGSVCNGVRLDDRTVATAAHCVNDGTRIRVFEGGSVMQTFDFIQHPAFAMQSLQTAAGVDLARILAPAAQTSTPSTAIRRIVPGPVRIDAVTRSGELRSTACRYLGRSGNIVELQCAVSLGWSGAPIIQDGTLVGILSARDAKGSVQIVQMADATLLDSF